MDSGPLGNDRVRSSSSAPARRSTDGTEHIIWGSLEGSDSFSMSPGSDARRLKRAEVAKENAQFRPEGSSPPGSRDAPTPAEHGPSASAALHSAGKCKPCAWVWKPGGCSNGWTCTYCHLCDPGELKSRRKEKIARLKAEKRSQRSLVVSL
mmetsp:Transcript_49741/g.100179  ORF Transcript_49741/g.100179 Transcript_49741/m.100179 type:complete len:151 (-) Transcript_49741:161-613(-)